jgi:hypothetical protein
MGVPAWAPARSPRLATAQRHWHHCATTLAQTHALAAFDPHYWSLLLAGASARVYHSANIWPRPRPVFSGQIISVAGKEEVQRECSREVAERALMERSDLADKALRVEARTCERFTTAKGSRPFRAESNRPGAFVTTRAIGIEWADDEHRPVVVLAGPVEFVADIGTDCAPQISRV